MKKKIFFYACFLLIGCFIGINITKFKSRYVDVPEEEKGLYIKYGEQFPIETFNTLGKKKNKKMIIYLYIESGYILIRIVKVVLKNFRW